MYIGPQRKLNRHKNIDYSLPGFYHVTICTKEKFDWFGKIINQKMELNPLGKTINKFWNLIPEFYKNIKLDEYIIMPDHIHGIIQIKKNTENPRNFRTYMRTEQKKFHHNARAFRTSRASRISRTEQCSVPTKKFHHNVRAEHCSARIQNYGLLSKIIKSFKNEITKNIRSNLNIYDFQWHRSFHDRLLRNENELIRTRNYIKNNPKKWQEKHKNQNHAPL